MGREIDIKDNNNLKITKTKNFLLEDMSWQSVLENYPDHIMILDKKSNILYINHTLPEFTKEQVIGTSFFKYALPKYKEVTKNCFRRVLKTGKPDKFESIYKNPDGILQYFESHVGPIFKNGKIDKLIVRSTDITKIRQMQETYHSVVEKSLQGLAIGQDGSYVFMNQAYADIFGYSKNEMLSMNKSQVKKLIYFEDKEKVIKRHNARVTGKRVPSKYNLRITRKDGNIRALEGFVTPIIYQGKPSLQMAVLDISEYKNTEEKLRESERRFHIAIKNSPDFIVFIKKNGIIFDVNRLVKGYTKDMVIGQNVFNESWYETIDQAKMAEKQIKYVFRTGKPGKYEYSQKAPDGSLSYYETKVAPFEYGKKNDVISVQCVTRDITDRKCVENNLKESEARYRILFEDSPVSIWEEDFSKVKTEIDLIKESGVKDFKKYFKQNSKVLQNLVNLVKIVRINKVTNNMFNINNKEDLLNLNNFFTNKSYNIFKKGLICLIEGKQKFSSEAIVKTLSGNDIYMFITWSIPANYKEDWSKIIVSIIDLTERKRIEEAQRESEEKFRGLADKSFDMIFMMNINGIFTYVSPAVKRIFGTNSLDVTGRSINDFIPDWELPKIKQVFAKLKKGENIEGIELETKTKDDDTRFIEVNITPITKYKKVVGYQGIARDITKQKHTEREMKKQLMKFSIDNGKLYFVQESSPTQSIEAVKDLQKVGYSGLVLSRTPISELKPLLNGNLDYYWLSEKKGQNTFSPKLQKIKKLIEKLSKNKFILFERLDYLIFKFDFKKILEFVQYLREYAIISNNIVILSIDPSTLNDIELKLIEKETLEILPSKISILPEHLLEILKFIFQQNSIGIKPSHKDIAKELHISKPTTHKRLVQLISSGYTIEKIKGRNKILELTEQGKTIFF